MIRINLADPEVHRKMQHAAYMRRWYVRKPGYKAAADRKYREAHRDKLIAHDRERAKLPERIASKRSLGMKYRAAHRGEMSEYFKEYYQQHKERWKDYNGTPERKTYMSAYLRKYGLQQKYGITVEQYEMMFAAQEGLCAICRMPPTVKSLHVDHCHATGKIRGLLCTRCNNALERLEKHAGWGTNAQAYLEER